jgi:hypothetical protein
MGDAPDAARASSVKRSMRATGARWSSRATSWPPRCGPQQDAEDRRAFVAEKVRSGEWKLLGPLEPSPTPPEATGSTSAASPGSATRSAASRANPLKSRIRAFLHRTEPGEARRGDVDEAPSWQRREREIRR